MKIDRSAWERTLNHNHFGAERANPGALALGEVFGNRVFRECVRDVVVDWCEGVECFAVRTDSFAELLPQDLAIKDLCAVVLTAR